MGGEIPMEIGIIALMTKNLKVMTSFGDSR